ncbi:MAG: methyltransferase domain-containing protein [Balneolales bacterium]|nr:methyltransferase domain-containing protein [Balneolales bacterium]
MSNVLSTEVTDIKEKVAQNFGDKARDYNLYAFVQRKAAGRFAELAEDVVADLESPYLELGCGTGFITQPVLNRLSGGTFFITDLSPEMLESCQRDLAKPGNVDIVFEQRDAEDQLPENSYGLITTALTAQWFESTENTLLGYLNALKPGGVLMYSYLDDRCFPEWKALCAETGIPFTGNVLPPAVPLSFDPERFSWEFFTTELFTEEYDSPSEFFRNLKRIGAGTQRSGQKNNPGAIVQLNEQWSLRRKNVFQVTYGITFGGIRRKRVG